MFLAGLTQSGRAWLWVGKELESSIDVSASHSITSLGLHSCLAREFRGPGAGGGQRGAWKADRVPGPVELGREQAEPCCGSLAPL